MEIADNKEQPYCFKEIAEAFELDWKGRRYLRYIAWGVLGNIGGLLAEYNKKEVNEMIPCVNASVVTKWERDHGNKWFCNGGVKATTWCCYPPYISKDGEDDRKFILELCKIVKEAEEETITSWKKTYYELLKKVVEEKNKDENKFKFAKKQEALDKVYEKCQNKKAKEDDNDKENKEKDDNNK